MCCGCWCTARAVAGDVWAVLFARRYSIIALRAAAVTSGVALSRPPTRVNGRTATELHSWARQHAWLLLKLFPFPVGHPEHELCSQYRRHFQNALTSLILAHQWVICRNIWSPFFENSNSHFMFVSQITFGIWEMWNVILISLYTNHISHYKIWGVKCKICM